MDLERPKIGRRLFGPDGLALFEECSDAFTEVGSGAGLGVGLDGESKGVIEPGAMLRGQQLLDGSECERGSWGGLVGARFHVRCEILRRDNFGDEAETMRVFRGEDAAREQQ